jgi:hypothetical protein
LSKTGPSKAQNGLKTAPKGGFWALKAVSAGAFCRQNSQKRTRAGKTLPIVAERRPRQPRGLTIGQVTDHILVTERKISTWVFRGKIAWDIST